MPFPGLAHSSAHTPARCVCPRSLVTLTSPPTLFQAPIPPPSDFARKQVERGVAGRREAAPTGSQLSGLGTSPCALGNRPLVVFFFFSLLSAGQRGSLSSLSWLMSPHLWTNHYLLCGEASFETHLSGNPRRRAGGDTMPRVPKSRSVPTAFLCTASSILPERVLLGLALTSPKRQRATSLALTLMVGLRHVSS